MQMPFERVLVTGGTGFIGRYVTARLVAGGSRPVVTHFGLSPEANARADSIDIVNLDLRDRTQTAALVAELRPELVIHLAGVTGQSDPDGNLCDEVNYEATVHLLDRLVEAGMRKLVMVGTAAEYGAGPTPSSESQPDDPRSPYAVSRARANRYALSLAETSGIGAAILRLFSVYGIGQPMNMFLPQLIDHAVAGREFPMTAGTQLRDFVHVDDVAAALIAAAETSDAHGLINIGALRADGDGAFDTLADIRRANCVLGWRPRRVFMTDHGPGEALVEMIEHIRAERKLHG
jgi:UDP-glucose 4-epimerase